MTDVAIVDSGGANIASLRYALDRLGASSELTTNTATLRGAARVILPGVGNASDAMARLRALRLDSVIRTLTQPVLGICLGMQLLFQSSEEGGDDGATDCLGVVDGTVRRLSGNRERPIPHMGWNQLQFTATTPLFAGLANGVHMYFVHGYAAPVGRWTQATTAYGESFTAVVAERNFCGTQFHPERSAHGGSQLLANFLRLGRCA